MANYFTTKSLDEVRIAHITQIEKALTEYQQENDTYPEPYKGLEILKNNTRTGIQGYMGEQTLDLLGLERMVDPDDGQYYTYYVSDDAKEYELISLMENDRKSNRTDQMLGGLYSIGEEGNIIYANV